MKEAAPILRRNIDYWLTKGTLVSNYPDPFADDEPTAPEPEAPAPAPVQEQPAPTVTVERDKTDENYATVIIRADKGYEAPNISLRGKNIPDLHEQVQEHKGQLAALMDDVNKLAKYFRDGYLKVYSNAPGSGGSANAGAEKPGKPAGANQPPNGQAPPTCKCGEPMKFLSGTSNKTGKPYAFFACPKPQNEQCEGTNGYSHTVNYKG